MQLFFRKIGEGQPLIFLHGVFGSSDNLFTVSKQIADAGFAVYTLDARNHGLSPRDAEFNYDIMADDINEFLNQQNVLNPIIIGHSMGGKTVLRFSQKYDNFQKIIIVDIAAKYYPTHHDHILAGLAAIDVQTLNSRKEAEEIFGQYVSDFGEKQFILKNLYRTENGGFDWRINIPVIKENIYLIGSEIEFTKKISQPTLMLAGAGSSYVDAQDIESMKTFYTDLQYTVLAGANHWVHATQPQAFVQAVIDFCQ